MNGRGDLPGIWGCAHVHSGPRTPSQYIFFIDFSYTTPLPKVADIHNQSTSKV